MPTKIAQARTDLQRAAKGAQSKRDLSKNIIESLGFLAKIDSDKKATEAAQEEGRLNRKNRLDIAKIQAGRGGRTPKTREEALLFFTREATKNFPLEEEEQRAFVNANIQAYDRVKKGLSPFLTDKELADVKVKEPEGAVTRGLKALRTAGSVALDILGSPVDVFSARSGASEFSSPGVIESLLDFSQSNGDSIFSLPGDISPEVANASVAPPAGVPGLPGGIPALPGGAPPLSGDIPGLTAITDNKVPVNQTEFNALVKQHGAEVVNAEFKVVN